VKKVGSSLVSRQACNWISIHFVSGFICSIILLALAGCTHTKQVRVEPPPPPPITGEASSGSSNTTPSNISPAAESAAPSGHATTAEKAEASKGDLAEPKIPANAKPIETETGLASWYGPPYHNRRGSNGEVYNMHAMTAAHRTLPLGSIVRVTNLQTGHKALVRITDRGPFIPGRIVDLSLAAARKVDVYSPGVAEVRLEVMETPESLVTGGRWAVQIGGFPREKTANKMADHLRRRYQTAKVQSFPSPAGDWWVRVHVLDDDRGRAQKLAAETHTSDGAVFLVRLD
jgi:rare lipoprotein A